jgi:hypothetical protein
MRSLVISHLPVPIGFVASGTVDPLLFFRFLRKFGSRPVSFSAQSATDSLNSFMVAEGRGYLGNQLVFRNVSQISQTTEITVWRD